MLLKLCFQSWEIINVFSSFHSSHAGRVGDSQIPHKPQIIKTPRDKCRDWHPTITIGRKQEHKFKEWIQRND